MVPTETGPNATTRGSTATALPQSAEHAAAMAFSSPAQPLRLPDMGLPVSVVMAAVAAGAGVDRWSQQSCADATTTSEAIGSSLGTAKAPAIGSNASDSATKEANKVRSIRMRLLERARISIGPGGRSSDDFASRLGWRLSL